VTQVGGFVLLGGIVGRCQPKDVIRQIVYPTLQIVDPILCIRNPFGGAIRCEERTGCA